MNYSIYREDITGSYSMLSMDRGFARNRILLSPKL
jgi:hypothetical protein